MTTLRLLTPDKIPPGYKDAEQIAQEENISRSYADQLLRQQVAAGNYHKKRLRVISSTGDRIVVKNYFKPKGRK